LAHKYSEIRLWSRRGNGVFCTLDCCMVASTYTNIQAFCPVMPIP
jgi:hypothetical protein